MNEQTLAYGNQPLFSTRKLRRKHDAHVGTWIDHLGKNRTMFPTQAQVDEWTRKTWKTPAHNLQTTFHKSALRFRFDRLPEILKQAVIPPPKYITTQSQIDPHSHGRNPDMPDNIQFYVMGINDRVNADLDDQPLNDRHFRECCVQANGNNLFLEPKHGYSKQIILDENGKQKTIIKGRITRPQTFLDPIWLSKKLNAPYHLALQLKEAFKRLQVNEWHMASRIINGITGSGKIHTPFGSYQTALKGVRLPKAKGLTSYAPRVGPPNLRGLEKAINLLSELGMAMDAITVDLPPMINMDLAEDREDAANDPYWANADLGPEEQPFMDDDMDDLSSDSNPYTAHALKGDGSDALPEALVQCMKTATDWNLATLAKAVRPHWINEGTKDAPRWTPPNRGMSDEQTSHFWSLWQDRRAKINAIVAASPETERHLNNLSTMKTRQRAAAYIYALRDGKEFKHFGEILNPNGNRFFPSFLKVLWAAFNEAHKAA